MENNYCVYILSKEADIVYIGISNNPLLRKIQHKNSAAIDFDTFNVILWNTDKATALLFEKALIQFASQYLTLKLKNKVHNKYPISEKLIEDYYA